MNKTKTTVSPVSNSATSSIDFFEKAGNNCKWLVLAILTFMGCFLFRDFLLGNKVYLFKDIGSDTLNGIYPYLLDITRQTGDLMFPKWSFDCGMGSNDFPLMFRDPFDVIIYYSSVTNVPYLLVVKELLKVVLSGFLFFLFLKELSIKNFPAIVGSIMFAFCGFMIVGGGWYMFSFEGFNMALLLYGYERFLSKKKWGWFVFGIFLMSISMPVNLFWYGLFLFSYILFRQYQKNNVLFNKPFLIHLGRLILLSGLGILLAGPFFLEVLHMLLNSPRGSGDDSYYKILSQNPMFKLVTANEFGTSVMRFFSSDMLGGGTNYKGHLNFLEAPMFYCGLPCLLLMPQAFGFFTKKTKMAFIVFIAVWCLPIIFPYFRNAFWLFAGDYYRGYSFFVSLVFMLFSVIALDKIIQTQKINKVVLSVTGVLLFILIFYPFFKDKNAVDSTISLIVKAFLVTYFILLMFYIPKAKSKQNIQALFLILFIFEVLILSNYTVNKRNTVAAHELKEKVGYNDYSVDAVNYIKKIETPSDFYRVEKSYFSSPAMHGSLNDGMIQDYKGTSCYHSFSQLNYVRYLRAYNVIDKGNEMASRWAPGLISRPVLQSLNSVKYLMVKAYSNPLWRVTHDSLTQFGDVKVLRNKYNLPFGYTYDKYIDSLEFESLSAGQKEYISLQTATIESGKANGLAKFNLKDTISPNNFNLDVYKSQVNALKADSLVISSFNNNNIKGTINCNKNEILCVSIPFDKGWHAKVDGKDAELNIVNSGHTGLFLPKGKHTVELYFELVKAKKGVILSIVGLLLGVILVMFRKKIFSDPTDKTILSNQ
ncbi:MAG: YfhO family protein [Bacteroidetes bacterium]|nr:YfhO family protein [Bacteroidota bacterium]